MSAKLLKGDFRFQEVAVESIKPGNLICGYAGHLLKVKETMRDAGAFFVAFENAPPIKIPAGGKFMLCGQMVL